MDLKFKMLLLAFALIALGGCATNKPRADQRVEIRVGETKAVGPDGLELTLRFVSEDSGCLSATDCSKILFHGSIGARKGDTSDLFQAQAIGQPGHVLTLDLGGYPFLLTDIRRDRQNRFTATFVVPDIVQSNASPKPNYGDAFLVLNKARPGVVTTADGLQYEVIEEGHGAKPVETDSVEARYTCTHTDGAACDAKASTPQVSTFALRDVIKGWSEGLQLMPLGAKCRFVVPPELAYGEHPPAPIKPNETLVFEVELLRIVQSSK